MTREDMLARLIAQAGHEGGELITLRFDREARTLRVFDRDGEASHEPLTSALPVEKELFFFADTCLHGQGVRLVSSKVEYYEAGAVGNLQMEHGGTALLGGFFAHIWYFRRKFFLPTFCISNFKFNLMTMY